MSGRDVRWLMVFGGVVTTITAVLRRRRQSDPASEALLAAENLDLETNPPPAGEVDSTTPDPVARSVARLSEVTGPGAGAFPYRTPSSIVVSEPLDSPVPIPTPTATPTPTTTPTPGPMLIDDGSSLGRVTQDLNGLPPPPQHRVRRPQTAVPPQSLAAPAALQAPPHQHTESPEAPRFFYGWVLVGAVFIVLLVSSGLGFYNASVILSAAIDELDAPVSAVSGATGLFFAISGLTGFAFSKRLDSTDIRWFYIGGGIVGAVALLGLRFVTNVVGLYIFFALFGVGFALAGLVPSTTLVTRWFDRRRAVALSIASTGLSMGGIVLTPVSAWLIDQRDLAGASPWLAALWVVGIIPIALLFLRSHPSDRGLHPDGRPPAQQARPDEQTQPAQQARPDERAEPVAGQPAAISGVEFATARRTRFFIALCFAYAVIFFGQVGAIAQLFNMVKERTDVATASTCLSVLALTSVVARLVGGAIVIRLPTKPFTALLAVVQAAGLVFLALATTSTSLILSSALFGISIGNLLMLQPLLLAEAFGVVNYGRIYSLNQLFGTIGVAGGPLGLGVLHDLYDYEAAFYVAAGASLTGFVFMVMAGSTSRVQRLWM